MPEKKPISSLTTLSKYHALNIKKSIWLLLLFLAIDGIRYAHAQNFVTIGNPASTVTNTRAPFYWLDYTSYQRYSWSNILLTDSLLATVNLPDSVLIDSIAFFKLSANAVPFPFFLSMHMGAANQAQPPLLPSSWINSIQTKREVLRNTAFQIGTGQGPVVFRFSRPYAYWGGGIELATLADYGPFPGNAPGGFTPNWVADANYRDNFTSYSSNQSAFDSTAFSVLPSLSQNRMPVLRIFFRQRSHRDLALTTFRMASPIVQANSATQVQVAITNEGKDTLFSANLSYQVRHGAPVSQQFAINLPPDSSTTVTFSTPFQVPMAHQETLRAWVNSLNGGLSDQQTGNDSLRLLFNTTIPSDTVHVGAQQTFPNLQALFNQLMAINNPKQLTIILHENQQGNFTLSNYQLPNNERLVLTGIHDSILLQTNLNGTLLLINNVRGVQVNGLRLRHLITTSTNNLLLRFQNSSQVHIQNNQFLGGAGVNRNHLVLFENCREMVVQNNLFSLGNQGFHATATTPNTGVGRFSLMANRFENQLGTGILFSGTQPIDSVWIEENVLRNSQVPASTAAGIDIANGTRLSLLRNSVTGQLGQYGIRIVRFEGDSLRPNRIINNVVSGTFANPLCSGLKLQGVNQGSDSAKHYMEVYYNSIQVRGNAPLANGSGVIDLTTASTLSPIWNRFEFRNNLVLLQSPSNSNGAGVVGNAHQSIINPKVTFSHNHYHAPGQPIFRFSSYGVVNNLTVWRSSFPNAELFSTEGNPLLFDAGNNDLRFLSNSPLSRSAMPIAGITTDIEGNPRTSQPDKSAYIRQALLNSTHLTSIVSPAPGTVLRHDSNYVLAVKIKNLGDNAISQLQFGYVFGFRDTIREDWTGQLLPGDSLIYSFNQPMRIRSDSVFIPAFKVWNRRLSGNFTPNPLLDSLTATYCTPLSAGTYLLKDSSDASNNLNEWLRLLHCGGITGNVTLKADFRNNVLLNQTLVINDFPGASSNNRLIIDGDGDTLRRIGGNTLRLVRTKHTTIKGFVFDANSNHNEMLVLQNADSVTICKNRFICQPSTNLQLAIRISALPSGTPAKSNSISVHIDSNHFIGRMTRSLRLEGNFFAVHRHLRITNNIMEFNFEGAEVSNIDSGEIAYNEFTSANGTSSSSSAIHVTTTNSGLHIHGNKIYGLRQTGTLSTVQGIRIRGAGGVGRIIRVYNNLIFDLHGKGTVSGIYTANSTNLEISNNTIYLKDTLGASRVFGMFLDSTLSSSSVRNNNISVVPNGLSEAAALTFRQPFSLNLNFNNYHVDMLNSLHGIVRSSTTTYTTMASYRLAFPQFDSSSYSVEPLFRSISAENFSPKSPALYQTGIAIPYILMDYQRNLRPIRPSIGAIEDTASSALELQLYAFREFRSNTTDTVRQRTVPLELMITGTDTIDTLILRYRQNQEPWRADTLYQISGRQILTRTFGPGVFLRNGTDTLQAIATITDGGVTLADTITKLVQSQFFTSVSVPHSNDFELPQATFGYQMVEEVRGLIFQSGPSSFNSPIQGLSSIVMSAQPSTTGFPSLTSPANAFELAAAHLSQVRILVNPGRTGKLRLSFRLQMTGAFQAGYFRVQVNGNTISSLPSPGIIAASSFSTPTNSVLPLTYALDSINAGVPLIISLQSVVARHFNHPTNPAANIIDSLRIYFEPDVDFTGLSLFSDTVCSPVARTVSVVATPFRSTVNGMELHYQTGLNTWAVAPMTNNGALNGYSSVIPPQSAINEVRYFVKAIVSNGLNWSSDTLSFENSPYGINLGPDKSIFTGQSTTLQPRIVDSGIKLLRISEFHLFRLGNGSNPNYPAGITSVHDDMVEIANYGADAVSLDNAEFHFNGQNPNSFFTYHFPAGVVLQPLERAVLVVGAGSDNLSTKLFFTSHPANVNVVYVTSQKGFLVLRERMSKRFIDGIAINDSIFPAAMMVPNQVWTGVLGTAGASGVKRTNLRAFGAGAWSINSASDPHNIGIIDSSLRAGPTPQEIRWLDAGGQLIATGDSLVVSPNTTRMYRIETNWYNCLRADTLVVNVTTNPQPDLSIARIISPEAGDTIVLNAPLVPRVRLKNLSGTAANGFTIHLFADSVVVSSLNFPQTVGGFDSIDVNLPAWTPNPRSYNLCYQVIQANDFDTSNNRMCRSNVKFLLTISLDESNRLRLLTYPNPVRDVLYVQTGGHLSSSGEWKVMDATGRYVSVGAPIEIGPDILQFTLSHLSGGIYHLCYEVAGKLYKSKFVVLRAH